MLRILLSALILLFFVGCGPRYGDFFPCHDDGTVKPRVVLLPISDVTGRCDVAEAFMQCIRDNLMDHGILYVYPEESVNRQLERMGNVSFLSSDISYANQFGGADFVVATELVTCKSDQYGNVEDKCMPPHLQRKHLLMVKIRIRVIDLRCNEPTIVLQEMLERSLLMPCKKPGEDEIDRCCFRLASRRLIDDYVKRLEDLTLRL